MNPRPFQAVTLRNILVEQGVFEASLAAHLGITKSGLSRKINGSRSWKLDEMTRAAKYLGMNVDEVFPPVEYIKSLSRSVKE